MAASIEPGAVASMDPELLIIHAVGRAALYVGGTIAGVWLIAGVFAVIDAWRAHDPRRSMRRRRD